ncbi:MAG TPA: RDD family protein [Rhizomicrobium sp.]|nr:RDD family protein [Rhizomicrobium sp.]
MPYASWGDRALGYIIDSLFVFGVMIILYVVLGSFFFATVGISRSEPAAGALCCLSLILFPLSTLLVGLYNRVYLVSLRGYSIGQGVMKLKVVDAQGALLSQGTALIRLIVQAALGFVPLLPILDLLWPLWDPYRQTLHDKAVGCYVINNPDVRY